MERTSPLPCSQAPATCPYPGSQQPSPRLPIPLLEDNFNIIHPSTPTSSRWSIPSGLPTKTLYAPPHATCPAHIIILHFLTWTISGEVYISLSSSSCKWPSPIPSYPALLRPRYLPQYSTLKHPKSMFFPQCDRSRFTPIQNIRQYYISSWPLYVFIATGTQKKSAPNNSRHSLTMVSS
jgi:hypothetical protein